MKKNYVLTIAMGIVISSTIGGKVWAADPVEREATVELKVGDGSIPPEIIDPEVKPPTGQDGLLTIDAVSHFKFPLTTIGKEDGPINAITTGEKLGVQVTDNRGAEIGWNLTVKATEFQDKDDNKLKGAVITIPEGALSSLAGVASSLAPAAKTVEVSTSGQSIMRANSTQGRSSWLNLFEGNGGFVTLTIPPGNISGDYTSMLTWTLEDAP